jgi:Polyketide cyclase / dehydrase and lipid transport
MFTVAVGREVTVPAEVVWEVFTDLANRPAWLSTVENAEPLTSGPFGVGTRWRETRTGARGITITEELAVLQSAPARRCVLELVGEGADYQLGFTFAPIEVGRNRGGCTISAVLVGTPVSRTSRLLAFFLGGFAARTVEGALRADLDALATEAARRATEPDVSAVA